MAARFALAFCLAALAALPGGNAFAQQLARLHVQSFTLTSDTPQPKADVPFDVVLTIHVREALTGPLDNVVLPAFAGPDVLGDERVLSRGKTGSTYRETLRLVAHAAGPLDIGSAYLDAVDARDGKAKRFLSNELHLRVSGGSPPDLWGPVRAFFGASVEIVLLLAAAFVVVTVFRRKAPRPAPPPAAVAPPPPAPAPQDRLQTELGNLRLRRDREAVLRVRAALWHAAGAREGETLADVLTRAGGEQHTQALLRAVERAAFVDERYLQRAVDDVLEVGEGSPA